MIQYLSVCLAMIVVAAIIVVAIDPIARRRRFI